MIGARSLTALVALSAALSGSTVRAQNATVPDTVDFASGSLRLRGLVWKPRGTGPFPAILFTHGSGRAPYTKEMESIGPFFASNGYVLFWPSRRGQGLSIGQGQYIVDLMDKAESTAGPDERSRVMAELLSTEQLDDELAALAVLKKMPGVDSSRIAVEGNSFGGILAVLLAERAPGVKAVVASAPAAQTWASSPHIRAKLESAARNARAPIYFMQAENDYDLSPSRVLSGAMRDAGKPAVMKIYPPFGTTTAEGHSFGYFGTAIWGPDVLAFLKSHVR